MVELVGIELEPFSRRERSGSLGAPARPILARWGENLPAKS
jgi:hypothetical protein